MKIAVVDHVGNWGGGSRFCRALVLALKKYFPEMEIAYFSSRSSIVREDIAAEFTTVGIDVKILNSLDTNRPVKRLLEIVRKLRNRALRALAVEPRAHSGLKNEIESVVRGYDLVFFPWPYFLEFPDLKCPIVAVFHDFNFKYFFGAPIFTDEQCRELNRQMVDWLSGAKPVVSSHFTASELAKFYPSAGPKTDIVHLAPFSISSLTQMEAMDIVRDVGVRTPYALYPTNLCCHKNLGVLVRAIYLVRQRGFDISLVISGPGTERVTGRVCARGVQMEVIAPDVIGLGYVSNLQIDALIQCATVVISTSLYEAGNGPGLEAWSRGVPVIMSDIPSFIEHIDVLGVEAQLIDPYDANDIAEKIEVVLSRSSDTLNPSLKREIRPLKYSWREVASRYHEIFVRTIQNSR